MTWPPRWRRSRSRGARGPESAGQPPSSRLRGTSPTRRSAWPLWRPRGARSVRCCGFSFHFLFSRRPVAGAGIRASDDGTFFFLLRKFFFFFDRRRHERAGGAKKEREKKLSSTSFKKIPLPFSLSLSPSKKIISLSLSSKTSSSTTPLTRERQSTP